MFARYFDKVIYTLEQKLLLTNLITTTKNRPAGVRLR